MDEAFGESVYRHYRLCLTKEAKAPEGRLFSVPYGDDYSDLAPFLLDLAPLKPLVTLPNPGYCFGRQREVEEVVTAPARARYEAVLPLYRQVGDVLGEANCIRSLGDIALRRSDDETARARYEEALPLYRQVGGVQGEANCIQSLGHIALRRSDHETARARYEEALPLYRQVGDVLARRIASRASETLR